MPELDDQYFCTAIQMPYQETYITNFIPKVVTANAHHVVVFGCKEPSIEGDQDGIAKYVFDPSSSSTLELEMGQHSRVAG